MGHPQLQGLAPGKDQVNKTTLGPPTNAGGGGVRVNLVQTGWCELKSRGYRAYIFFMDFLQAQVRSPQTEQGIIILPAHHFVLKALSDLSKQGQMFRNSYVASHLLREIATSPRGVHRRAAIPLKTKKDAW
jgi:hypothetical protein